MIQILETGTHGHTVLATLPTFAEAKTRVIGMGCAFMEDDADYADCADAYLNDGRIIAIQPVGFTTKDPCTYAKVIVPAAAKMAAERKAAMESFDAEFLS